VLDIQVFAIYNNIIAKLANLFAEMPTLLLNNNILQGGAWKKFASAPLGDSHIDVMSKNYDR
jgi:hypothetical protein